MLRTEAQVSVPVLDRRQPPNHQPETEGVDTLQSGIAQPPQGDRTGEVSGAPAFRGENRDLAGSPGLSRYSNEASGFQSAKSARNGWGGQGEFDVFAGAEAQVVPPALDLGPSPDHEADREGSNAETAGNGEP